MFKKKKIRRSLEFRKNNQIIDFEKARELRMEKRRALAQEAALKEKEPDSRRRASKKARRRVFFLAVLIICIAVISSSVGNILSIREDLEAAQAEKAALEAEKARLEYRLSHMDSLEYIEYRARTVLRMIIPGELYFVIQDDD